MIKLSVDKLNPVINAPNFTPQKVELRSLPKELTGIEPETALALIDNYNDFAGTESVKSWLVDSIQAGTSALISKVGNLNAVNDLGTIESSLAATRLSAATIAKQANLDNITQSFETGLNGAILDITEAQYRVDADLSLTDQETRAKTEQVAFEKQGGALITRLGYTNESNMALAETDAQLTLEQAITDDEHLTRATIISTKAMADANLESGFTRVKEIALTNVKDRNRERLTDIQVESMIGEAGIKANSIAAASAIDVSSTLLAANSAANNALILDQTEASNIVRSGAVEAGFIIEQNTLQIGSKRAMTALEIQMSLAENNLEIQLDAANTREKITSIMTVAGNRSRNYTTVAAANATNDTAMTGLEIASDTALNAQEISNNQQISLLEIQAQQQTSQLELIKDAATATIDINNSIVRTNLNLVSDANESRLSIVADKKRSQLRIQKDSQRTALQIQHDGALVSAELQADAALSAQRTLATGVKAASFIAISRQDAQQRIGEIKAQAEQGAELTRSSADKSSAQSIADAQASSRFSIDTARQMVSISSWVYGAKQAIQTSQSKYADDVSIVKAQAQKSRAIYEHTDATGFQPPFLRPALPGAITVSPNDAIQDALDMAYQ